jgi:hypothetical protein
MPPGVGTTHHVKIGDDYHLVRPGTYVKQEAPLFGARFTSGDPDYNTLNLWQYWAQRCWVGGFGAEAWMDDAMYDEAVGVDTTQHEVMVLTRDLVRATGGELDFEQSVRRFIVFNDNLYCLSWGNTSTPLDSKLWRWDITTYEWILIHTFNNPCRGMAQFAGRLYIGDHGTDLNYMTTGETFVAVAKPGSVTDTPFAMAEYRGRLYVAFGNQIWRLKNDNTWDGSTVFYTAEGVDRIVEMEVHLGFLYMVSENGHVLRTDGNNTFDLWAFDPGIKIASVRSFDGRLFVSCNEPLDGTNDQQAVLYQFSGSAVTELKRWGEIGKDVSTGRLRVIGKRLFFGAPSLLGMDDGFGVAAYDPREDAYHLWASDRDIVSWDGGTEGRRWAVDDVVWYGGYVFASVYGHGIFRTRFTFKDVTRYEATYDTTAAAGSVSALNGGWISSSDFDAGTPGLLKYWDAITVHVDLPTTDCSVYVEVSGNGGEGWREVGSVLKSDASTTRYAKTFHLTNDAGEPLTRTRLKWRLTLRTTDLTRSPQVRGVIVRYLPIPEPNWRWEMNLVLSDHQELLDKTVDESVDVATKLANLETAFRTQIPIHFTDVDGTEWGAEGAKQALITSIRETTPAIGPSSDGVVERDVRIVLIEVKDSYEVLS